MSALDENVNLGDVGQCCAWHEQVPFFSDINYNNLSICLEYKWLVQHFQYFSMPLTFLQECEDSTGFCWNGTGIHRNPQDWDWIPQE